MPTISRADLARLAGVSKAAITQAVKGKRLAAESDGSIDTELPVNAQWLAEHRDGRKGRHAGYVKPPPKENTETLPVLPVNPEVEDTEFADILESNSEKLKLTKARRLQAEADTRLKAIREAKEKGELLPRDIVRQELARFDATLKTYLRDMPRRIAAQVHALARSGEPMEVEAYLEREIAAALVASIEARHE